MKVHPKPVDKPVAPVDGTVIGKKDTFDRETSENDNRRNFAQMV